MWCKGVCAFVLSNNSFVSCKNPSQIVGFFFKCFCCNWQICDITTWTVVNFLLFFFSFSVVVMCTSCWGSWYDWWAVCDLCEDYCFVVIFVAQCHYIWIVHAIEVSFFFHLQKFLRCDLQVEFIIIKHLNFHEWITFFVLIYFTAF